MDWNWVLIIAGALLILGEVALGGFAGFDLVLIGSSFLLGGALGLVFGSTTTGFITASALCVAYIVLGRKWVRTRLKSRAMPSNTDALMGRRGLVTARVAPHTAGMVKVNDETWRAMLAADAGGPLEPGTEVTIAGVDGVTLLVR
jgi:membrane protein implicated in regulation of membrane protease activity